MRFCDQISVTSVFRTCPSDSSETVDGIAWTRFWLQPSTQAASPVLWRFVVDVGDSADRLASHSSTTKIVGVRIIIRFRCGFWSVTGSFEFESGNGCHDEWRTDPLPPGEFAETRWTPRRVKIRFRFLMTYSSSMAAGKSVWTDLSDVVAGCCFIGDVDRDRRWPTASLSWNKNYF